MPTATHVLLIDSWLLVTLKGTNTCTAAFAALLDSDLYCHMYCYITHAGCS
jgi:hypothetical protein